jgi:mRNA-degrading endonuclease toxin of MazEF toxin-antitoxin module
MDSVIMTDNLATVRYSEIDRVLGVFSRMTEVNGALRTSLGL